MDDWKYLHFSSEQQTAYRCTKIDDLPAALNVISQFSCCILVIQLRIHRLPNIINSKEVRVNLVKGCRVIRARFMERLYSRLVRLK